MPKMTTWLLAGALALGGASHALANDNEKTHEHQKVTLADLPPAAQDSLKREAKGGDIEEIRKETKKDGTVIYEAEIVKNGKGRDINVNADGTVTKRGKMHDEKSEREENEKK